MDAFALSAISVNAPWQTMRIEGWKLPLIVDTQGEILPQELFEKLSRKLIAWVRSAFLSPQMVEDLPSLEA